MDKLPRLRCIGAGFKVDGSSEVTFLLQPKWAQVLSFYPTRFRMVPVERTRPDGADYVLIVDESRIPMVFLALAPDKEPDTDGVDYGVLLALGGIDEKKAGNDGIKAG